MMGFLRGETQRAGLDDDHRVGARHPAGEHADRRARRPARARAALPDPRPRRALARARVRVPAVSRRRRRSRGEAAARLATLSDYTELGSGFKIAMRDLEIRGAGNLLGAEQSGHVAAVGFELYMQMLDEAVQAVGSRQRRRARRRTWEPVRLDVPVDAYVPAEYIPYEVAKIDVHRRIAAAREPADLGAIVEELEDRFGPLPAAGREPRAPAGGAHQARPRGRAHGGVPPGPAGRAPDRARLRPGPGAARGGRGRGVRVAEANAAGPVPRRAPRSASRPSCGSPTPCCGVKQAAAGRGLSRAIGNRRSPPNWRTAANRRYSSPPLPGLPRRFLWIRCRQHPPSSTTPQDSEPPPGRTIGLILLALAALAIAAVLSSAGGVGDDDVADVEDAGTISKEDFDHWLEVVAVQPQPGQKRSPRRRSPAAASTTPSSSR